MDQFGIRDPIWLGDALFLSQHYGRKLAWSMRPLVQCNFP